MLWLTGIVCLAVGLVAGVLIAKRISGSNPAKVTELETRVQELQRHHAQYRDDVSDHFNTTAELVQQMTESYRDVYQHLAGGAQDLCTDDVANKLLPATEQSMFYHIDDAALEPPKDYAPKKAPGQSGALAENFGLNADSGADKDHGPYTSHEVSQNKSPDAGQYVSLNKNPDSSPDVRQNTGPDANQEVSQNKNPDSGQVVRQETRHEASQEYGNDVNQDKSPEPGQIKSPDSDQDKDPDESREKSKNSRQALEEN